MWNLYDKNYIHGVNWNHFDVISPFSAKIAFYTIIKLPDE